jgi:hypothetical protein
MASQRRAISWHPSLVSAWRDHPCLNRAISTKLSQRMPAAMDDQTTHFRLLPYCVTVQCLIPSVDFGSIQSAPAPTIAFFDR